MAWNALMRVSILAYLTLAGVAQGADLVALERRPIGVSPEAARIFQMPIGAATPLPAAMEITYRPVGRIPFQSLIHVNNIKALFVGENIIEGDGDNLRRRHLIHRMDFENDGRSFGVAVGARYESRFRRTGEHLEIGIVEMPISDRSPDGRVSDGDWRIFRDQLLPGVRALLERGRIEECVHLPRYPDGRVANDTAVGVTSVRELLRRYAECAIALGSGQTWAESEDYKRRPELVLAHIEQQLISANVRLEANVRVQGTVQVGGAEFIAIGGALRISGRGESALPFLAIPIPAGVRVASFESQAETQTLVDPYSGAVFKHVWITTATAYPAEGSQSSAFITAKLRGDYFGDVPRLYAAVTPAPPTAVIAPPAAAKPPSDNLAPSSPRRDQREPTTLVGLYRDTVDSVFTVRADANLGTAFAAGANLLITARHVVRNSQTVELENTKGLRFRARVLYPSADVDIAYLVPTSPQRLSPLAMAADVPPIGTKLVVIGSPVGLDGTLTTGTVSQLRPIKGRLFLQFEGFVTKGNSGGPIMDLEGKVLGVVMAQLPPEIGVGLNFGVSAVDVIAEAPKEARAFIVRN